MQTDDEERVYTSANVEERTIHAVQVEKLETGDVRVQSGGNVSVGEDFGTALSNYADHPGVNGDCIYGGYVPLYSMDSSGFTPEEILDAVLGVPVETALSDIDGYESEGGSRE